MKFPTGKVSKGSRKPGKPNLGSTFGIKGASGKPGKGAVTGGKPANKTFSNAKRNIKGGK